jgi:hypothetical protein
MAFFSQLSGLFESKKLAVDIDQLTRLLRGGYESMRQQTDEMRLQEIHVLAIGACAKSKTEETQRQRAEIRQWLLSTDRMISIMRSLAAEFRAAGQVGEAGTLDLYESEIRRYIDHQHTKLVVLGDTEGIAPELVAKGRQARSDALEDMIFFMHDGLFKSLA